MSYTIYARTLTIGLQVHVDLGETTLTIGLPKRGYEDTDMPVVDINATSADLIAMGFSESTNEPLNVAVRSMIATLTDDKSEVMR